VDRTARVQTITEDQNPQLYSLLEEFKKLSGVPILLNTSFNIAGEPIVETPMDAVKCFMSTALDALAISNYLIIKKTVSTKHDPFHDFITSLGRSL
jgi:carbamoyltransferase